MELYSAKKNEDEKTRQYKKWNSLVFIPIFHVIIVFVGLLSLFNINSLQNSMWEDTLIILILLAFLYFVSIWLLLINEIFFLIEKCTKQKKWKKDKNL